MEFVKQFLSEATQVIHSLDLSQIEKTVNLLATTKANDGRLFILGVGGSAANASHAVNDFRKIVGLEAYAPTDNVSELTARTNDDGFHTIFSNWLRGSSLNNKDAVLVFSVGGGSAEKNISANICHALDLAKEVGAKIFGVVGRDGGYTAKMADACVIVPVVNPENVTPHTESFQALVWHLIVSHPKFRLSEGKWESTQKTI